MNMECPECGKEEPYHLPDEYEVLVVGGKEAKYRCRDCGEGFWWSM